MCALVLVGQGAKRQATTKAVQALAVGQDLPSVSTVVRISTPSMASTRTAIRPSSSSRVSPTTTSCDQAEITHADTAWRSPSRRIGTADQGELVWPALQHDLAFLELLDADLRSLQVGQHAHLASESMPRLRARQQYAGRMVVPCVPCEKFRRTTLTPARTRSSSTPGASVAGPRVARIFVRRRSKPMWSCPCGREHRYHSLTSDCLPEQRAQLRCPVDNFHRRLSRPAPSTQRRREVPCLRRIRGRRRRRWRCN